jgi:pyruvoyl-dependent arginine decarboxylase (PvlArgDC)
MTTTDSTGVIPAWEAFAHLTGEIENPNFDAKVDVPGKYKFEFASLAGILKLVRPLLSKYGFSLTQSPNIHAGVLSVVTRIVHKTGVVVAESCMERAEPKVIQQLGSEITYLRRYGISACLGIAAEQDDDGGAASENNSTTYAKVADNLIAPEQAEFLLTRLVPEFQLPAVKIATQLAKIKKVPFYQFTQAELQAVLDAAQAKKLVVKDGQITINK